MGACGFFTGLCRLPKLIDKSLDGTHSVPG
jgi:hypothetical protein